MSIVTNKAIIREMDAEELVQYLHELGTAQECMSHETSVFLLQQVQEVRRQYRHITGQELSTNTAGLTIAASAMVHAAIGMVKPEIMGTL